MKCADGQKIGGTFSAHTETMRSKNGSPQGQLALRPAFEVRAAREAEILVLRQQLLVLSRKSRKRVLWSAKLFFGGQNTWTAIRRSVRSCVNTKGLDSLSKTVLGKKEGTAGSC
jgi:hypothetical protein